MLRLASVDVSRFPEGSLSETAARFAKKVMSEGERSRKRPVAPSDFIAEEIARLITFGAFQGGDHLRETEMAERFNVSRTIIREAFSQLKKSGLIDSAKDRGVRVSVLTPGQIEDIYEVRSVLLMLAARRAVAVADARCGSILAEGVPILHALADDPATEVSLFVGVHAALGSAIVVGAGNPDLTEVITATDTRLSIYHFSARTTQRRRALATHWASFEAAFLAGDETKGAAIVQTMIAESRAELFKQIDHAPLRPLPSWSAT
jgi:DNA-binding GntR family transcriptional regulator